jgi:hypothetical protein
MESKSKQRKKKGLEHSEISLKKYDTREGLLYRLDEVIQYLYEKAMKGRIREAENEKVRVQWFKTLLHACNTYNQIKKDVDLEELEAKIEKLSQDIKELTGERYL